MSENPFYQAAEIMQIMAIKQASAYNVIRKLNAELQQKGFLTFNGRVPRKYFEERYCCDNSVIKK